MCQAVRQQGAVLHDLLPPADMLHLIMMHPLRVQVSFSRQFFITFSYNVTIGKMMHLVEIIISFYHINLG